MLYAIHMTQFGEGCDYTIACGQKNETFEADSDAAAVAYVKSLVRDEYGYDDRRLEDLQIYRVADSIDFDLKAIYSEIDEEQNAAAAMAELRRAEEALKAALSRVKRT